MDEERSTGASGTEGSPGTAGATAATAAKGSSFDRKRKLCVSGGAEKFPRKAPPSGPRPLAAPPPGWTPPAGGSASAEVPDVEMTAANAQDEEVEEIETRDYRIDKNVISPAAAQNPRVLYEAGVVCCHDAKGELVLNSAGEKVINFLRWENLEDRQILGLRRQGVNSHKWEEIPWTGRWCYLFAAAWEIGRLKSANVRDKEYDACGQAHQVGRVGA